MKAEILAFLAFFSAFSLLKGAVNPGAAAGISVKELSLAFTLVFTFAAGLEVVR